MGIQINKRFLPLKAHYFLFNAGTAPVVPFMPTLIKQLGYSSVVLGLVYTVLPIISILTKPIFGIIADKLRKQKLLFLLFQLLTAVGLFSAIFVPSINREANLELTCDDDSTKFKYCMPGNETLNPCVVERLTNLNSTEEIKCESVCQMPPERWREICTEWKVEEDCTVIKDQVKFTAFVPKDQITDVEQCLNFKISRAMFGDRNSSLTCTLKPLETNCRVSCNDPEVADEISNEITVIEASRLYQFWLLFLILIASWSGMAVVVSVGDAICFEMLGDKPQLYGYQRLWGSVGWGVFSFLAGYLVDQFSKGQYEKNYSVVFYMAVILIGLDIIISTKLKHHQTKHSAHFVKDLKNLFSSIRVVIFFLWCVAVGLGTAMIWNFLFWHLEELGKQEGCNGMDWMKTLQGIVMGIQCLGGELPFFWLSGYILKKFGHINTMTLVLAAFGFRFLCYSFLVNPWYVLPVEFLNGLTFGLFYATMASYASIVAPEGTEATMQGIVGGIFEGVGVSIGSLVGGILMNSIGGSLTYRYFAIAALILAAVHFVIQLILKRNETHEKVRDLHEEILSTNDTVHESLHYDAVKRESQ